MLTTCFTQTEIDISFFQNLIGLEINDVHDPKTGLFVRDLPLYPLPIVMDDMPTYSLLNMFDLGMSRSV